MQPQQHQAGRVRRTRHSQKGGRVVQQKEYDILKKNTQRCPVTYIVIVYL